MGYVDICLIAVSHRSGSTLLETMFDSHGQIWGMGEDSLFNGNLTMFRDALVRASSIPGEL